MTTQRQEPAEERDGVTPPVSEKADGKAQQSTWVDTLGRVFERWVPDALTTAIGLMVVVVVLSMALGRDRVVLHVGVDEDIDRARHLLLSHSEVETVELNDDFIAVTLVEGVDDYDFVESLLIENGLIAKSLIEMNAFMGTIHAYYKGLWNFLSFTMQMTLILVLSLIVSGTPVFKNVVVWLSRFPRTRNEVVALAALFLGVLAYVNWGLGLALGPIIAIHFCREAERKGIPVDFLFLLAVLAGAGSVWQFGLSATAPLVMATPGQQIVPNMETMPISTTIWSVASIVHVVVFMFATIVAGCWLMPKRVRQISEFADAMKVADMAGTSPEVVKTAGTSLTPAKRLEQSSVVLLPLVVMLAAWLYFHFFEKGLGFTINMVNTSLLLAGIVLHRNVANFQHALREAIKLSWPVVVLYHLYAGVAGLIQFTPVGEFIVSMVEPISTPYTFPLLVASISTVVAIFIPTSGGQWAIQGSVTSSLAEAVGVTAQRGLLALSVGDHMGNLLTPFWAVVGASIARVDFRLLFGYRLIFAALWFGIGVLCFTFLPC
jgi:short-chain fatty acids transporter